MIVPNSVQGVLDRLQGVKRGGQEGQWSARCPAHDDRHASLSIGVGEDGKALVWCHAGCSFDAIVKAAELEKTDMFVNDQQSKPAIVALYDYADEAGKMLYQAVRYTPKDFRQRRPDGKGDWIWDMQGVRRVLYRLPELMQADKALPVFVVEGEKDVDRLRSLGLLATCNVGGAGKWRDEYSDAVTDHP